MAKKQGVSYSPNTALIQGAGVAYRNYDNMPGMYGGLDKVITAGTEMMEGAIKGFEAEEKKKQEIEKRWNDTSDQVLLNAGALGDVLYKSTYDDVSRLKQMYLDGVNEKDDRKRMQAMIGLQNHSNFIQDHKKVNLDYAKAKTDGTLSAYYTKNPEGRKEAHIIEQISGQKYNKTSKGEDGDTIFHIPAFKSEDGSVEYEAMDISSKEYNDMMTPKNFKVTAAYTEARAASYKQENFEEEFFRQKVRNSLPNDKRGWNAASYDDVSGKNLEDMLRTSETLDQEIINAIDPKAWDTDPKGTAGVLDPSEKEAFIDAVMNTENDFFNLDVSKKIMEDQLVNAGRNSHTKYWENKKPKITNITTGTGFLATANTKKPKGVMSGTLDRSFNYNISKNMYDQFKLSSEGKPAEFSIGSTNYKYDVENNNWVQTTGDGTKKDLGDLNATLGPKGFAIVDPDFLALRTAATEITENTNESIDLDTDNRLDQDISTVMNNIDVKTMSLDDNIVAENIQKYLPLRGKSNPKGYQFLTTQDIEGYGLEKGGGDPFKEGVTLYELAKKGEKGSFIGPDGNRIKAVKKDGKNIFIKTGGDLERRREGIKELDKILNSDFISKILLSKPRA